MGIGEGWREIALLEEAMVSEDISSKATVVRNCENRGGAV